MKKRKSNSLSGIPRTRGGLIIIIVAAALLEATACIQYFYSRNAIQQEAVRRAQSELRKAELEINVVSQQVEMAVKAMALMTEHSLDNPQQIMQITKVMVEKTPYMTGAAIAFLPGYFPQCGKFFEAYSLRVQTHDTTYIRTTQIGSENHDYTQLEWFNNGLNIDSCYWCEPYFDNAGANATLVSCSYPIRNKNGEIVAVALGDVSLEKLQHFSQYLLIYPKSFYSITSGKGNNLVTAPDTVPGKKYQIFNEFIDATGWTMSIIIPDEIIFADIKKVGLFITILMLIGLLLLAFIIYKSAVNIIQLINTNNKQQRIESELNIASKIQMSMLPKLFPPYGNIQSLNMFGLLQPAKEVGGDFFDFHLRDNKLFFCIGDVSGKGVPASLVMAMTISLFRTATIKEDNPAEAVATINNAMAEKNEQNMFVTLFLGVLDLKTGLLTFCNAGHNSPLIIRQSAPQQVITLDAAANIPIGVLAGYRFTPQQLPVLPKDTIFLYTDGLTEAENIDKQLFGEDNMNKVAQLWLNNSLTAQQQITQMNEAVANFVNSAPQSDDLTMLAVQYLPQAEISNDITDEKTLIMRNDIKQIPTLAEWIDTLDIPQELNMTINLALEEIVSNVMLYAYPQGTSESVEVKAKRNTRSIIFTITDSGKPFDPTKAEDPDITLPTEQRPIGGLGIHLVRQIMDEIKYQRINDKNILTLIKHL